METDISSASLDTFRRITASSGIFKGLQQNQNKQQIIQISYNNAGFPKKQRVTHW